MNYNELLEVLNRDTEAMQRLSGAKGSQLKIVQDEKEMAAQLVKEQDELIRKTKRVIYPFYFIGGTVAVLIAYGKYQQDKLIKANEQKLAHQERINSYQYT